MEERIEKAFAVEQVREMAYQFADMYFTFAEQIRAQYGDEKAKKIVTRVLFRRAKERAEKMISDAEEKGLERIPDNIGAVSKVPYLGWDSSLGRDHCPYGAAWLLRIKENPWFAPYAALYCDVTDTTIAEVFTGKYSHKLTENVVLGGQSCERIYFLSDKVEKMKYTYDI